MLPPLLEDADVAKFVAGRLVSEVGSRITREGLPVAAILAASASASELGLLAVLAMLPALVLGTAAGTIADRTRRRPLMVIADLVRAALLLTVPAAALLGRLTFAQVAAVTALMAAITVLFQVADRGYVPSLVAAPRLAEANALLAGADGVGESLGPALMGVLVQAFGVPFAMVGDAVSYVVSAISLISIRRTEAPPAFLPGRQGPSLGEEEASPALAAPALWDGLRAVTRHPVLRPLAGLTATTAVFGGFFAALYELYVLRTLHLSAVSLGLLITCGGVGGLVGAALAPAWARHSGTGRTLLWTFALSAAANVLVPLAGGGPVRSFVLLLGAQFIGDLFGTVFSIGAATLEQTITPGPRLGRVEGALQTLAGGLGVAGALIAGWLGGAVGLHLAFWLAAAGNVLAVAWLLAPRVRSLDAEAPHTGFWHAL